MGLKYQGPVCVDLDDQELVMCYQWNRTSNGGYLVRVGRKLLHREITGEHPTLLVDHSNGDVLDNRRSNLRLCTRAENVRNRRIGTNSTTGAKGVYHRPGNNPRNPWEARITIDSRPKYLGCFATRGEAVAAYNAAAQQHYGEFARLNP